MSNWKPRIPKIEVVLIPETSFGKNLRELFKKEWDSIRQLCYALAGHRCEICGEDGIEQGFKHAVEAHELWEYSPPTGIQRLKDIVALCPLCHQCHHLGFAQLKGNLSRCLGRIALVNEISDSATALLWLKAQKVWELHSMIKWELDVSFIQNYLTKNKKHKAAWAVN